MRGRGRFFSIASKLTLATLGLLAAASAVTYVGMIRYARESMLLRKERSARMAGELFLRSASTPVLFDDAVGIRDTVSLLAQNPEVLGIDLWRAVGSHGLGANLAGTHRDAMGVVVSPRWLDSAEVERLPDRVIFRGPVVDPDGDVLAVAAVQYSLAWDNAGFAELERRLMLSGTATLALLGFLVSVLTRRIVRAPLVRLLRAAKQIEDGESHDLGTAGANDEVGRLADAFSRMADAVQRRERDIARANEDMKRVLDNVGQGFLVLDPDGRMAPERSAIVDRWFGTPSPDQLVSDYLREVNEDTAEMLELGLATIRAGLMPLEVCLEQLPRRMRHGERHYAWAYHPVRSGETLHQLVAVISDVTSEFESERADAAQRDVIAAFSRLMADKAGFIQFLREAGRRVDRIVDAVQGSWAALEIMRDIHTLKGDCALVGLTGIASFCQAMEDRIRDDACPPTEEDTDRLNELWSALMSALHVRISVFSFTERRAVELSEDEYRDFRARIEARAPHGELLAIYDHWVDDAVLPRLRRLAEHAELLARRLGKCSVTVDFEDTRLRLPREPWSRVWPHLGHLVRNAVDHGIETEAERLAGGKPAAARLTLSTSQSAAGVSIVIADDGRGIDWDRLQVEAESHGLPCRTRADLVAAMFRDGVTTRDMASEISGRGVGLAAV
ncbi:MAG TPA: Hpt domain-containing protein, partial [Candidatus Acidoferrum sp.]|nr:Hpt domain-containing protein [Candidatus Acidoferrum sp.]